MKIDVTVSFNEVLRDTNMSILDHEIERCVSILRLKIHVTTSLNEHLRDVTAHCNKPLRDGRMPSVTPHGA